MKPKKYGRRYPWAQWFARGCFRLEPGKDFSGRVDTFLGQLRNRASRERRGVSIRERGKYLEVTVHDLSRD